MFCRECGTRNIDNSIFCESCGAKLVKPRSNRNVQGNARHNRHRDRRPIKAEPRPSKAPLVIGVLLLLIISTIVLFFLLRGDSEGTAYSDRQVEDQAETNTVADGAGTGNEENDTYAPREDSLAKDVDSAIEKESNVIDNIEVFFIIPGQEENPPACLNIAKQFVYELLLQNPDNRGGGLTVIVDHINNKDKATYTAVILTREGSFDKTFTVDSNNSIRILREVHR